MILDATALELELGAAELSAALEEDGLETDAAAELELIAASAASLATDATALELAPTAAELRAAELTAAELRAAELRAAELRAAELKAAELRAAELTAAELRAAELTAAELRAAELRAAELRAAELRAAELRAAELSAASEDTLEIDATALELLSAASEDNLEIDAAADLELEPNAASEEDGLALDTPLLEAAGAVLVGAKAAADEVAAAAAGELDDTFAGEAASAGAEDGLAGPAAGALDAAKAGTAAPARTRRWLSFMSKEEIPYEDSIGEACARRRLVVPLRLKSPWSLDLGKAACRGNGRVGFPSLCKEELKSANRVYTSLIECLYALERRNVSLEIVNFPSTSEGCQHRPKKRPCCQPTAHAE